jgi:hypothetical protein
MVDFGGYSRGCEQYPENNDINFLFFIFMVFGVKWWWLGLMSW